MDRGNRRKSIFSLLTFFSSPQASSVICKYTTSSPRDKISSTIFPALPLRGSSRDVLHAFITNAHRFEVIQIFSIQLFYSDTKNRGNRGYNIYIIKFSLQIRTCKIIFWILNIWILRVSEWAEIYLRTQRAKLYRRSQYTGGGRKFIYARNERSSIQIHRGRWGVISIRSERFLGQAAGVAPANDFSRTYERRAAHLR